MTSKRLTGLNARADVVGALQSRLLGFTRLARANGFRVGIAEAVDAQRLAAQRGIMDLAQLRLDLRALLCSNREDWARYDALFEAYWRPHINKRSCYQPMAGAAVGRGIQGESGRGGGAAREADLSADGDGAEAGAGGSRGGASARESLQRADFQLINDAGQMRALEDMAENIARRMRRRIERRREAAAKRGGRLDTRHSIRNSLRFGGVPLRLSFKQRRKRPPRLLVLVDVSRSMSNYSALFLRFARGIMHAFSNADAFAYHTRLVHISHALRQTEPARLRESLQLISQGWGGGTKIGECMRDFNREYGNLAHSRTVVVMVSDGLDTGDGRQLGRELARLKQRCRKLVWLNPLLGRDGYEPKTAAMLAALPFIDVFAPAHNLRSLQRLESTLASV